MAGAILSVVVLATACSAPSISPPFARQPVITPQQARSTFLQLESERTAAINDRNKEALSRIESRAAPVALQPTSALPLCGMAGIATWQPARGAA